MIELTKEQFDEAVKKSLDEFAEKGTTKKKDANDGFATFIMNMQNAIFASILKDKIFGEETQEDK